MGRLFAVSDLHLSHKLNREQFDEFFAQPSPTTSPASKIYCKQDGLILAGDVSERVEHIRHCFGIVTQIFGQVWWVPGNHELYTMPSAGAKLVNDGSNDYIDKGLRGQAKYLRFVDVAREYGIHTPEDEYVAFTYDPMSSTTSSSLSATDPSHLGGRRRLSSNKHSRPTTLTTDPRVHGPRYSYSNFLSAVDETTDPPLALSSSIQNLHISDDEDHDDEDNNETNINTNNANENDNTDTPNLQPQRPSSPSQTHRVLVCPIFTLYDYSFRPATVSRERAVDWAAENNNVATDEFMLHPDPYPSRDAWCDVLVSRFGAKLTQARRRGLPLVIVNHWPLRQDLVYIPQVPRFSLWCGTTRTDDWHVRFGAACVVTGHLHVRRTDFRDGVRFEECSVGYPRQWELLRKEGGNMGDCVREIMPGLDVPVDKQGDTIWRGGEAVVVLLLYEDVG